MLESFLNLLLRHRRVTLAVGLLLFVTGIWKVWDLSVNDAPEHWMPRSTVRNWERFAEHFDYGDTVVIGVEFREGVKDSDITLIQDLRSDLQNVAGVIRVTDVAYAAELIERVPITTILETPTSDNDPYELYRGVLFDDPRVWNPQPEPVKPGDENRTVLVVVEIDATTDKSLEAEAKQERLDQRRRQAVVEIFSVLKKHERDDVTFHPAGAVIIQHELEKMAHGIVVQLVPVALLLMLVTLGFGFRSTKAVFIALVGGGWAIIVLMGGVVLGGWTLNVVTVGGPILMVVITVSTTVHFAHYHSENGHPRKGASGYARTKYRRRFVRWVAVPCFGAALTTGFGFLMLGFNELKPLRELGVELFAGSILAFFGSYLVWLALPSLKVAPGKRLSTAHMAAVGRTFVARPKTVLAVVVPMLAVMAYVATLVDVAVDPFSFFQKESYVAKALDHYSTRKFGHYTLDVVLVPRNLPDDPVQREAALTENRRVAMEFQKRIQNRPEVRRVISEPNVHKRLDEIEQLGKQAAQQGKGWESFKLTARAAALRYFFKPWLVDNSDRGAIRITFMVYDPGTGFRPLMSAVRSEVESVAGDRFDHFFTGTAASVAVLSEQLVGAMMRGLFAAMLTMAVVCVVLFRSIRLTLIACLPNAFPILTIFGIMGLLGIPLNSGSAMVASVALGVGLNDTVHFVMHYRVHRLEGSDCQTAVCETFGDTSRPMIMTSVVNCAGFAIFLLSDFQPMFHFGLLASIAMVAALVGDLVLLPNLLRVFDNRPARDGVTMEGVTDDAKAGSLTGKKRNAMLP